MAILGFPMIVLTSSKNFLIRAVRARFAGFPDEVMA
jgi:hypothetical protein